jgi:hypothetical protein
MHHFFRGKSSAKFLASPLIFKKLPKKSPNCQKIAQSGRPA